MFTCHISRGNILKGKICFRLFKNFLRDLKVIYLRSNIKLKLKIMRKRNCGDVIKVKMYYYN